MITSMTGFGRASIEGPVGQVNIEIRSVNARFLDIQIRCPQIIQSVEPLLREKLQNAVSRGKISVNLNIDFSDLGTAMPVLNKKVVERYLNELKRLNEFDGVVGDIDMRLIMQLPDVFEKESADPQFDQLKDIVLRAFEEATNDFVAMRRREGELLGIDIKERMKKIVDILAKISEEVPVVRKQVNDRLREKICNLLDSREIDEVRLAMEITLIAERSDITEELVRFDSHNEQFLETLHKGGEIGRKFNFLLQEMNREANTVCSKAANTNIVHKILEIKEELERIREQVQNLV